MNSLTVVFDFDGVIHSYVSGWKGESIIPDPPVKGIKEAIDAIRAAGYIVTVVSTRCRSSEGFSAIVRYLENNDIIVDNVTAEKPPAIVYIDDRAICFDGHPETLLNKIKEFKPWNSEIKFQQAWIDGIPCIFTIDRIDRNQYPNLIRYELMYDDGGDPTCLQTDVFANFYGTILSKETLISLRDERYYVTNGNLGIDLKKGDIEISNNFITMKEYMEG